MSLNEAETRAKLIDPKLHLRGWTEDNIKREETAGPISVLDGQPRQGRGRADYTLRLVINPGTQPVAIALIEAKAEHLPPGHGLEQAKAYAASGRRLHVPFVFSSNGHQFVEYDQFSGQTQQPRPMDQFPLPGELRHRYEVGKGFCLSDPSAAPLLTLYGGGEATRRYYQDAAIRAVLEKLAQGHRRALLALATGAGKTYVAVQLLKRIADAARHLREAGLSSPFRRALFVCDRDELRSQALGAFQNVFGNDAAVVSGGNPQKNARILIATYQTLGLGGEENEGTFLTANYPEDYFTHIIIDECHRSAWGKWSKVLTHNPNAVQVGLTATPRQLVFGEPGIDIDADKEICADNYRHFGEPVYEYEISQGIEDGYLAACEILKRSVNLDRTGLTDDDVLARNPVNAFTGRPVTRDDLRTLYEGASFERRLLLPDRVIAMCADQFQTLLDTGGPEQKTIVFCASDGHADAVAAEMNNLYADWCRANSKPRREPYAFKCTASVSGNDLLPDFKGASRHHFIATTVDLLTTGVDVPSVRNVAFFRYLQSPIAFYQMVGRGTRLDLPSGKLMFRVCDYTNATRLFGRDFLTRMSIAEALGKTGGGDGETGGTGSRANRPAPTTVRVSGFDVVVSDEGRFILTQEGGRAMPVSVEEYRNRLVERLHGQAATLNDLRRAWIDRNSRLALLQSLPDGEQSAQLIRSLAEMGDYDLFDVLAKTGYDAQPRTRGGRAAAFVDEQAVWLQTLPAKAAETLRAIAAQFGLGGTEALESTELFQTPAVTQAGGVAALRQAGKPAEVVKEAKERLFAA